jgi:hypothetical protein
MRFPLLGASLLALVALVSFPASQAHAQIVLDVENRLWFTAGGYGGFTGANNFLTGVNGGQEYRPFLDFNLANLGGSATAATIRLEVPTFPSNSGGSPSANLKVWDVTTDRSELLYYHTGDAAGVAAFNDLGSGIEYGDATVPLPTAASSFIDIPLNATALAAINSSLGGRFIVGLSIADLLGPDKFLFAGSSSETSRLILTGVTAVPEPSTWALLGFAAAGAGMWVRRRRLQRLAA